MHRARHVGECAELPCSLSAHLSPNLHMFTNLKTPNSLSYYSTNVYGTHTMSQMDTAMNRTYPRHFHSIVRKSGNGKLGCFAQYLKMPFHVPPFSNKYVVTPILLHTYLYTQFKKNQYNAKIETHRDFPGGPGVKTPCFQCRGHGFNPWLGN